MPLPRANVSAGVTVGSGCINTLIRRALCSWASMPANSKMPEVSVRPSMKTTISRLQASWSSPAYSETSGILEFAGILAQEHSARLISVFMQPEPTATPAETFARGKGMHSMIEVHQAQLERIEADHRAEFVDVVRRHGIRSESEWRSLPYLSSEVGVHAYYADLVVIARPESASQTAGPPGLAESLVLSSGRPIILFPPRGTVSQVHRILVAWNATRESIRAVADALPVLVRAKAVEVLVVDHERNRAGHGQEPGADIARHLTRHGAHVEVRR